MITTPASPRPNSPLSWQSNDGVNIDHPRVGVRTTVLDRGTVLDSLYHPVPAAQAFVEFRRSHLTLQTSGVGSLTANVRPSSWSAYHS